MPVRHGAGEGSREWDLMRCPPPYGPPAQRGDGGAFPPICVHTGQGEGRVQVGPELVSDTSR